MTFKSNRISAALVAVSLFALFFACRTPRQSEVRLKEGSSSTRSVHQRLQLRSFPSVFSAWGAAENLNDWRKDSTIPLSTIESKDQTIARHDLVWRGLTGLGLLDAGPNIGLIEEFDNAHIAKALAYRKRLLDLNPNMILIAEIRYRDASGDFLPEDSPWWKRDRSGSRLEGWAERNYFLLDYSRDDFQDHVAKQCQAAVAAGVVDGCFFDWWNKEDDDRIALLTKVRSTIGDDALIIVNVNGAKPEKTASMINGVYMEGLGAKFFPSWQTAGDNLEWAMSHLRPPVIAALDCWFPDNFSANEGRKSFQIMRAATTLVLTRSDGFVLFGDPNSLPTSDHLHDWYPFWDKSLGRAVETFGKKRPDGAFERKFEDGTVVYNPTNAAVNFSFPAPIQSVATGEVKSSHVVNALDGDIFTKIAQAE